MAIGHRIGTFFIVVGVGLIVLFILSDLAKAPSCNFLITGAISLALGIVLWVRDPGESGSKPERFRTMKKIFSKKPEKSNEKKKN